METPKLNTLKKELQHLSAHELVTYLTRVAKYKTENKELLNFLLFYKEDPESYVLQVKQYINEAFEELPTSDYLRIKQLRKVVRSTNKHLKFLADKKQDAELLLFFCNKYIDKKIYRTKLKVLQNLFLRQFVRFQKSIQKLDNDLIFDYTREMEELLVKINENKIYLK